MQCRYCRAWNEEDERRCVRCGRRMVAAPRVVAESAGFATATATAPALELVPEREQVPTQHATHHLAAPPSQPLLFRDAAGGPKVIPIPTLTPQRTRENPEWIREERAREESAQRRRAQRTPRAASRNGVHRQDVQQSLDFYGAHGGQPSMGAQMEAVIYCDAPVAPPSQRSFAALFDGAMVALGLGLFLGVFVIAGGAEAITASNALFFLAIAGLVALFYRFLFCIGNGDTPGMRFAGLRLVDFDGRVPDRERRGMRQIAGVLSLISAGLGLVWALVDEESLTWHDHISKTFPTVG
jgi:uncharacterized RDD family membrane protein YckC